MKSGKIRIADAVNTVVPAYLEQLEKGFSGRA